MSVNEYFGGNVQHIKVGDHTKDVQAYLDYYAIVGDDDGGKMMSDAEFEAYKKKVAGARANHLYVYYVNSVGNECKAIGPSSMCFCKHRFRNNNFDNVTSKKVNCKNCKCKMFNYIPIHGSMDIKCLCHHSYEDHDPVTRKCLNCKSCSKFSSNYTCDCGQSYNMHKTVIETRKERMEAGKAVDSGTNMAAGVGGLTSFTSMVGAVYNDHYSDLLEGNPINQIKGEDKYYLGDGSQKEKQSFQNQIKDSSSSNSNGVLNLINTPNKFGGGGSKFAGKKYK